MQHERHITLYRYLFQQVDSFTNLIMKGTKVKLRVRKEDKGKKIVKNVSLFLPVRPELVSIDLLRKGLVLGPLRLELAAGCL